MTYDDYTARMCPVCHCTGCSPECPEFDGPLDAVDYDEDIEFDEDGNPIDPRGVWDAPGMQD